MCDIRYCVCGCKMIFVMIYYYYSRVSYCDTVNCEL
nr:MAG TPA: hypothetical protein [Caudoviricetes sp.]DAU89168.1 MAG TPA: hypothetical protein [Caudoviricetes sp.]